VTRVERLLGRYTEHLYAITRIVVAMVYWLHGTTKLFDWPPGARPRGAVGVASLLGAAGVIETVCGALIMIGLLTRGAAFIASGQMAAAYFLRQFPFAILPIYQPPGILGESTIFNCFFFLYVAAKGPGIWSVDHVLARRRGVTAAPADSQRYTTGTALPRSPGPSV
jgi:putative oxidoreductase